LAENCDFKVADECQTATYFSSIEEGDTGFLPPDVNLKNKTPAFMLEKFIKKIANNIIDQ